MNVPSLSSPGTAALCRFLTPDAASHLGWWDGTAIVDLTRASGGAYTTVAQALASGASLTMLAAALAIDAPSYALDAVTILAPIDVQEVWAAGVTYERSREARIAESDSAPDVYARVYEAERPELFYKGNARLTAGPERSIRVRDDSRWTVPEPELAALINGQGRIAGYTIGNDVSARDIEGENPLYLPQAKVYAGACALGPWVVPAESVDDPYALRITCSISRDGAVLWQDETSTGQLHRRLDELVIYLTRAMSFPEGAYLLTGTCLVPPDSVTLQTGDVVEIAIAGLGTLRNPVG